MKELRSDFRVAVFGAHGRIGEGLLARYRDRAQVDDATACDGAVHVRLFTAADAERACRQVDDRGDRIPVVFISSLAERCSDRWMAPEPDDWAAEPWPADDYGRGKREAREVLEELWPGPVRTLLLGPIVAGSSTRTRLSRFVDDARLHGEAIGPGDGNQRIGVVTLGDVVRLVDLALRRVHDGHEAFQVGPDQPVTAAELIGSLLGGAGYAGRWRAAGADIAGSPWSAGDEIANTGRLQAVFPSMTWDDPLLELQQLGRRLADLDVGVR